MTVVGFDFGTTNSLISFVKGNRVINCLEEQRPIPSVICYEGTRKIVGQVARKRLETAGLGIHGNIVRSPKKHLGKDSIYMEGVERSPVDVVADVVNYISQAAINGPHRSDIGTLTHAVVTIPIDMHGYQRAALREAFRIAGLGIVQFVHEPMAALYAYFRAGQLSDMLRAYDRRLALVFDWGGGTLDLTLCRILNGVAVQIRNDGTDEVGGDIFDETIMNRLIAKVSIQRGTSAPTRVNPGAKARLLHNCELAKIQLSERVRAQIYVPSYFHTTGEGDFDYQLEREELEEIIEPLLEKGFRRIEKVLDDAGYAPEQIALCLATGGMSNMPAVKKRLHERFGPERTRIADGAATLIAEGAAWIANDKADLRLAKDVELMIARSSYLPLIKAGTAMPREREVQKSPFHLYCTDPRDGVAKMQICSPVKPGADVMPSEPRSVLNILTVKVDERAQAFQERLELDVRIDDNLIMTLDARSLGKGDQDRKEIHNLEFGLSFPMSGSGSGTGKVNHDQGKLQGTEGIDKQVSAVQKEVLGIRANVSHVRNPILVPGEFLFTYDRAYFDQRSHPPPIQHHEQMYYEPCIYCRRAANDPMCRCGSSPPTATSSSRQAR